MRIYISRQLQNPEFSSDARRAGIARLGELADVEELPAPLTPADAPGLVAVIADGTFFSDDFYDAADDLRVVARWASGSTRSTSPAPLATACRSPSLPCTWTRWPSTRSRSGWPP